MIFTARLGPRVTVEWKTPPDGADPVAELAELAEFLEDLRGLLTRDPETPLVVLASRVGALTEIVSRVRDDVRTLSEHAPPAGTA